MSFRKTFFWIIAPVALLIALSFPMGTIQASDKDKEVSKKAFMGIYPAELDDDKREALNFENGKGILIEDVVDDGPSEKAGLEGGDIIIKIGKQKIISLEALRTTLKKHEPDDKIKVLVLRDGKEKKYSVILGSLPQEMLIPQPDMPHSPRIKMETFGFLGVETMTLESDLAKYFEVKYGAMIQRVEEDTPAEEVGLLAGDVIVGIGDDKIESTSDLSKAIGKHKPDTNVEVKFVRKGKNMTKSVKLGERSFSPILSDFNLDFLFDNIDIDIDDIHEAVAEALEELEVDQEELEESMLGLKEEMKEMQQEMKKMKKGN